MSAKEDLEKKLEEMETCLGKATEVLSGYGNADTEMIESVEAQIQLLGDELDMRLKSLPKGAKEVRMSKLDVAILARILNGWARDLDSEVRELCELKKVASTESDRLAEDVGELEELKNAFVEILEEAEENHSIPELGLSSTLRAVESSS